MFFLLGAQHQRDDAARSVAQNCCGAAVAHGESVAKPRVLVISQDVRVREMLDGILTAEGFGVRPIGDVAEADEKFVPDVILFDASQVSSPAPGDLPASSAPMVVLTADRSHGHASRTGAQLSLPVDVTTLMKTIERLGDAPHHERFVLLRSDRRAAARPRFGDIKPCPACGDAMRFDEPLAPAWICRNPDCADVQHVRVPR